MGNLFPQLRHWRCFASRLQVPSGPGARGERGMAEAGRFKRRRTTLAETTSTPAPRSRPLPHPNKRSAAGPLSLHIQTSRSETEHKRGTLQTSKRCRRFCRPAPYAGKKTTPKRREFGAIRRRTKNFVETLDLKENKPLSGKRFVDSFRIDRFLLGHSFVASFCSAQTNNLIHSMADGKMGGDFSPRREKTAFFLTRCRAAGC